MPSKRIIKEVEIKFIGSLRVRRKKTRDQVVLALVGLVGTGKSPLAKLLAPRIGAVIIRANAIRVLLRKAGQGYEAVRRIAHNALRHVLERGRNAIMDSDYVDPAKRRILEKLARKYGAKVIYIRTVAERDAMIEGLRRARYNPKRDLFKSNVIAIREMWRRTPLHYNWSSAGGGRFSLKKLRIPFLTTIDTGEAGWQRKVPRLAKCIRQR